MANQSKTFDEMVEALEDVSSELSNLGQTEVRFETDAHNMLAWMGENLYEISETLKKIEAKMK